MQKCTQRYWHECAGDSFRPALLGEKLTGAVHEQGQRLDSWPEDWLELTVTDVGERLLLG